MNLIVEIVCTEIYSLKLALAEVLVGAFHLGMEPTNLPDNRKEKLMSLIVLEQNKYKIKLVFNVDLSNDTSYVNSVLFIYHFKKKKFKLPAPVKLSLYTDPK